MLVVRDRNDLAKAPNNLKNKAWNAERDFFRVEEEEKIVWNE